MKTANVLTLGELKTGDTFIAIHLPNTEEEIRHADGISLTDLGNETLQKCSARRDLAFDPIVYCGGDGDNREEKYCIAINDEFELVVLLKDIAVIKLNK